MVLSNKKLKRKLRDLVAASESNAPDGDAGSGGGGGGEDVEQQLQSVREILSSKSKNKPRPTRRRKKKPPPSSENEGTIKEAEEKPDSNGVEEDQEKDRKRKRDGDGSGEQVESKQKKKKEKKKKKKKKKNKVEQQQQQQQEEKQKDDGEDDVDKKVDSVQNEAAKVDRDHGDDNKEAAKSIAIEQSEQNPKKVYVGGIPYYSTEDDIVSFFDGCGTVTEVDCMRFPETGKFRGIAILTFKTEAAAKRALDLDGADMGGFYLKIQPYKVNREQKSDFAPEVVEGYNRIYAGNLAWEITEDDLKKLFADCQVSAIRFGMDKETNEFKGYAHVDFADNTSMETALKLDQRIVCGRPVRIRCAVPKKNVEKKPSSVPVAENAEDASSAGSSKKKRRTCYNCGVPGHLSSACPQKKNSSASDAQS